MQRTVDEIFDAPETVRVKARNGQRLVREKLAWDRAVAPLVKYLHAPVRQLPAGDLPAFVAGELGVMNYWSRAPSRSLRSMWSTARRLYAIGGWRHLAGESVNFVKRGIARTRHG
jgi:hypothetical protein